MSCIIFVKNIKKFEKKSLIYKFLACINIFVDEMGA